MRKENLFDLEGHIAVVTGGCGRLGPVWIEGLLLAGARVVGIDLPGVESGNACRALLDDYGNQLWFLHADITDRHQLTDVRNRVEDQWGGVDILVNNAGIDQPPDAVQSHLLHEWPIRQFHDVFNVNVVGTMLTSQVFAETMLERQCGSIINIGSLYAGLSPDPRLYDHIDCHPPFIKPPAYGASKAAVVNLTQYLAVHWASQGIRVNSLSPGGVLGDQDEVFKKKFAERVPVHRMAMAQDLIGPLIFLASDASTYVTGVNLMVDGGFSLW